MLSNARIARFTDKEIVIFETAPALAGEKERPVVLLKEATTWESHMIESVVEVPFEP